MALKHCGVGGRGEASAHLQTLKDRIKHVLLIRNRGRDVALPVCERAWLQRSGEWGLREYGPLICTPPPSPHEE